MLVILVTVVLIVYGSVSERIIHVTKDVQSQSNYEQLKSLRYENFRCPCSNTRISLKMFVVEMNATFHPVCSSVFVSLNFIEDFRARTGFSSYTTVARDFRRWGTLLFRFLQSMCLATESTVKDSIDQFLSDTLISTTIIPQIQFESQIKQFIDIFKKSIETQLSRILLVFRATAQGNGLISVLGTNLQLRYDNNQIDGILSYLPQSYEDGSCSCATSSACFEPASFRERNNTIRYVLQNIYLGCFTLESILHSSLSCFYSNSCLTTFKQEFAATPLAIDEPDWAFGSSAPVLPILPPPENSRFTTNDSIETMTESFFIDLWSTQISFEHYFNACTPKHCTYSYTRRADLLYTLTVFLSVFQGISGVLHFLIPIVVSFILRTFRRLSND